MIVNDPPFLKPRILMPIVLILMVIGIFCTSYLRKSETQHALPSSSPAIERR